jgi:hypothetical protein
LILGLIAGEFAPLRSAGDGGDGADEDGVVQQGARRPSPGERVSSLPHAGSSLQ